MDLAEGSNDSGVLWEDSITVRPLLIKRKLNSVQLFAFAESSRCGKSWRSALDQYRGTVPSVHLNRPGIDPADQILHVRKSLLKQGIPLHRRCAYPWWQYAIISVSLSNLDSD